MPGMNSSYAPKTAVISQVRAIANECAAAGWDGAGAEPASQDAVARAVDLIRALPDGVALPELAPEPDGQISLDWIQSRNRLFSLSVGPGRRLAYAWLDGEDRGHAVAGFDGEGPGQHEAILNAKGAMREAAKDQA
jgi:hypothetical protein